MKTAPVFVVACSMLCGCTSADVFTSVVDVDAHGNLIEAGTSLHGKRHGYWVGYGISGSLSTLRGYQEGEPHGKWLEWDKDGTLTSTQEYRNGRPWQGMFLMVGEAMALDVDAMKRRVVAYTEYFYENGRKNGPAISYGEPGIVLARGEFRDGKPWSGRVLVPVADAGPGRDVDYAYYLADYVDGEPRLKPR